MAIGPVAAPPPNWKRIVSHLTALISDGTYAAGQQLPSEHALATQFGTSRSTAAQAMDHLSRSGWVVQQHGRGSFVVGVPDGPQGVYIIAPTVTFIHLGVDGDRRTRAAARFAGRTVAHVTIRADCALWNPVIGNLTWGTVLGPESRPGCSREVSVRVSTGQRSDRCVLVVRVSTFDEFNGYRCEVVVALDPGFAYVGCGVPIAATASRAEPIS